MKSKPHPLNTDGDFFVGNGECLNCGAPAAEAPNLIKHDTDGHCYFNRQPSTREEVDQAIAAICASCCESIYYGGADGAIVKRLVSLGQPQSSTIDN